MICKEVTVDVPDDGVRRALCSQGELYPEIKIQVR
jgi:hypothetical protein